MSKESIHRQIIGTSAIKTASIIDGRRPVITPMMVEGTLSRNFKNPTATRCQYQYSVLTEERALTFFQIVDVANRTDHGNGNCPEHNQ